jgi:cyclophilin family peptidyl-prolyl cis-trans isomerase/HEAT repeat protein
MANATSTHGLQASGANATSLVPFTRTPLFSFTSLRHFRLLASAWLVCLAFHPTFGQMSPTPHSAEKPILQRANSARYAISRLEQMEDERIYDSEEFSWYFHSPNARVRRRAALAVGRIGDERSLGELLLCFNDDGNVRVRATAAFALGEIESARAVEDLLRALNRPSEHIIVRARAAEALGKIMSVSKAVKTLGEPKLDAVVAALVSALPNPKASVFTGGDDETLGNLAATALMRLRRPAAIPALVGLLSSPNESVRWHAANALARLTSPLRDSVEAKNAAPALVSTLSDDSALTRALAARALGPLAEPATVGALIKLLADKDYNVRISAIRALGASGDQNAGRTLVDHLAKQLEIYRNLPKEERPRWDGLPYAMEICAALGAMRFKPALPLLEEWRYLPAGRIGANLEVEVALARTDREAFLKFTSEQEPGPKDWRAVSAFASACGELAPQENDPAETLLLDILEGKRFTPLDARAAPAVLTSLAKLKSPQFPKVAVERLRTAGDVIIRATAAELLSNLPQSDEHLDALLNAHTAEMRWEGPNDAKLAILDALASYSNPRVTKALTASLDDSDYLVRRRAAEKLLERLADADDFSERSKAIRRRIGIVKVRHDHRFYQQLSREYTRNPFAWIETTKGKIQIELFMEDAPVTAENFIHLAERDFYNDVPFHRVVPNFVVQGGDPRGDGNGGPNFQIRCEINERFYERGSVGMALSGKDTGGSQFFICHSPQPHLDGGYTIFGQVTQGMDVVDRLTREDRILSVRILR